MIFSIIVLLIVGVVAFFHYVQGFFSATISAICCVIAAVLAVSYHETIVESLLGGRFGNVAHALSLSVFFAVLYLVLRVMFDKMVPGNLRMPSLVDRVGGAAMGLVAGVFAAGIVALTAQYLPLMPSIAGYARYGVSDGEVIVPGLRSNARSSNSLVWDSLNSEKPGEFDASTRQALLLPADDILVNTVSHLSDGGSLAWDRPLGAVHPDLTAEIFGQRLGIQAGAKRVVTPNGIISVDLFQAPASIARRDHEYKDVRGKALETGPLKLTPNQVLLVVRAKFNRSAGEDSDGLVRFSPASARLVLRKPGGAEGEMQNYYPLGTIDKANTLYMSEMDDFLLVDVRGGDKGVDLAYVVEKSALTGGTAPATPNAPLKAGPGSFFEFKRMGRKDLADQAVKGGYKAAEDVEMLRKTPPEGSEPEPATPAAPVAGDVEGLKQRLVGNWASSSSTADLIMEFQADGTLKYTTTPKGGGLPNIGQGTWEGIRAAGENALVIRRTINNTPAEATVTFVDNDNVNLTSANTPQPLKLQRRG